MMMVVIVCDIIIMFKVLKQLLEVAERYVILAVLSITAPLVFSMGGAKGYIKAGAASEAAAG